LASFWRFFRKDTHTNISLVSILVAKTNSALCGSIQACIFVVDSNDKGCIHDAGVELKKMLGAMSSGKRSFLWTLFGMVTARTNAIL